VAIYQTVREVTMECRYDAPLATSFLKYLIKMRLDTHHLAFEFFLEMPEKVKTRCVIYYNTGPY
jgi:hypothetical protein